MIEDDSEAIVGGGMNGRADGNNEGEPEDAEPEGEGDGSDAIGDGGCQP